ncbi:hypothetical protein CIHG_04891, partial [Coccidioides immitis H538.4]
MKERAKRWCVNGVKNKKRVNNPRRRTGTEEHWTACQSNQIVPVCKKQLFYNRGYVSKEDCAVITNRWMYLSTAYVETCNSVAAQGRLKRPGGVLLCHPFSGRERVWGRGCLRSLAVLSPFASLFVGANHGSTRDAGRPVCTILRHGRRCHWGWATSQPLTGRRETTRQRDSTAGQHGGTARRDSQPRRRQSIRPRRPGLGPDSAA